MKEQTLSIQSAPFVEVRITLQNFFNSIRQVKEKSCAAGYSDNRQTERTPRKRFRCGSEDDLIAKFPKPPKENEKRQKQVLLMNKAIVHATTERITVTKIYMHLGHACLVMTNVPVEILVTVQN